MRLSTAVFAAVMAVVPAAAAEIPYIGYRGDGTGVFPDDCKPVTTWKEFAGTCQRPTVDGKGTITAADPESREVLENIVWKTPMPNLTESSPIAVGKRVFTLCEPGWPLDVSVPTLVCVDGDSGRILWQQPIDHHDTLPEDQRAEAKRLMKLYWENQRLVFRFMLRSQELAAAKDTAGYDALTEEIRKAGFGEMAKKMPDPKTRAKGFTLFAGQQHYGNIGEVRKIKQFSWYAPVFSYTTMGMTFATPCSNGKTIFATTVYGAVAAFDLDGKRKWLRWLCPPGHRCNPGDSYSSPVLGQDGKLLIWRSSGSVHGIDAETGETVWKYDFPSEDLKRADSPRGVFFVGTGAIMQVGGDELFIHTHGLVFRTRDGKVLADPLHESMKDMTHQSYVYDLGSSGNAVGMIHA